MGLVDGVTTNLTLLSKEKKDPQLVIEEILTDRDGPVSLEVIAKDAEGMCEEARKLAALGNNASHQNTHDGRRDQGCQDPLSKGSRQT